MRQHLLTFSTKLQERRVCADRVSAITDALVRNEIILPLSLYHLGYMGCRNTMDMTQLPSNKLVFAAGVCMDIICG